MMKILFAGEGGQGVQVIAEILAKAAFKEGKSALYIPNFGVEQRGGISLAFVVVDKKPIVYPKFEKADILAILSDRSIERVQPYLNPETKVILSPAVTPSKLPAEKVFRRARVFHLTRQKLAHLPARNDFVVAKSGGGGQGGVNFKPRVWNILVLGKINRIGKIVSESSLIEAMNKRFARQFEKNPKLEELDLKALRG